MVHFHLLRSEGQFEGTKLQGTKINQTVVEETWEVPHMILTLATKLVMSGNSIGRRYGNYQNIPNTGNFESQT